MSGPEIVVNPALVAKVQGYFSDASYKELVESTAQFNSRLGAERTMRLPFLDSQTGVAQNHSNLFMEPNQRMPGMREGQIYTYPSHRWQKKRRQYLSNFMQPRYNVRKENGENGESLSVVGVESLPFGGVGQGSSGIGIATSSGPTGGGVGTSSAVAIIGPPEEGKELPKDDKQDWYFDELDVPDAGEFDEQDADSDYDYEESYSKRKKKKPQGKAPRGKGGRRKITYDPQGDSEKPFACDLCGARYKTRPGLTYHYTHSHKDKEEEEDDMEFDKRAGDEARRRSGAMAPPVLHPQQPMPPTLQPQQPMPPPHHMGMSQQSMMHQGHHPPPPHLVPQQSPHHMPPPHHPMYQHQGPPGGYNQQPSQYPPHHQHYAAQHPPRPQGPPPLSSPGPFPHPHGGGSPYHQQHPPPHQPHVQQQQNQQNQNSQQGSSANNGGGIASTNQNQSTDPNIPRRTDEGKPRVPPSPYCDFCLGDATENKKSGNPEDLVSCSDCGRSGHPSCLQFTANMIISVKKYRWQCIECKCCSLCGTSDNDDQLLFCDDCDRGYHMYCLVPKLDAPPEGSWSCTLCLAEFHKN